ncbi:MAG TPA: hypothetical protein VKB64_01285 [Gaiellaceae bacterium]|nr:hypothetical protein [Gaiellaceae bacterium]
MAAVRLAATAVLLVAVLAGCGSSGSPQITIGAARTFQLAAFSPARFVAGKPTVLSFRINQPSGAALTRYRTGSGPHTGVHLIIVRSDLGAIIHRHPKPHADGTFEQAVTFPTSGRYKVVVDAYPQLSGPLRNFQLTRWITVPGTAPHQPLPPFRPVTTVDGYRFALQGKPNLRAIQPNFLTLHVTRSNGTPATFTPWFGALAHAIFFRAGDLAYFHTHVCSAQTPGCTSILGGSRITGRQTKPGVLRVGVLLPVSGTWRLFLQSKLDGRVLTAPFTLNVR